MLRRSIVPSLETGTAWEKKGGGANLGGIDTATAEAREETSFSAGFAAAGDTRQDRIRSLRDSDRPLVPGALGPSWFGPINSHLGLFFSHCRAARTHDLA
jgi:hypothetical protein